MWESIWNSIKAGAEYLAELIFQWLNDSTGWLLGSILNAMPTSWQPNEIWFQYVAQYWQAMDYYVGADYGLSCLIFYVQFYLVYLVFGYLVKLL